MPRFATIPERPRQGGAWLRGIVLVLLAFAVYWPCLHGPFLWDDRNWSTGIEWLLRDPDGWWRVWTEVRLLEQYYPLTAMTVWLDFQAWGWAVFPRHVENVALHALSAVLLWRLLRRLDVPGAWLAAVLLVVHPVMVESVAWITERKNGLCLMLMLLAMLCWCRGVPDGRPEKPLQKGWLALATLVCLLAMLAKISACVVPAMLLVIAWWKRGRMGWRRELLPLLPMFGMALGLGVLIAWLERHQAGAMGPFFDELTWMKRVVIASQAVWFYLMKLVHPVDVRVLYPQWKVDPALARQWLGFALLLAGAAWLWRKGGRGQIAFALLFLGPLLPVLGFFNLNGMRMAWVADRWVYFSAPVFFAWMAGAVVKLPRRAGLLLAVPYVVGCCLLTWRQASNYSSMDTFWQAAIRGHSHPVTGHSAYGEALMREGRMEESKAHFEAALRLEPSNADLHCNMGTLLDQLDLPEQALASFQEAIRLNATDALFHYNLGFTLYKLGRAAEAEAAFREALRRRPDFLAAHNDLGNVLAALGRPEEAERAFYEALRCRAGDTQALASLGNLRYRQGRKAEALKLFEEVLRTMPDKVPVLANAARILATSGDAALRDGIRAVLYAEKAAQLSDHVDAGVMSTLAAAYAEAGRFDEAVKTARLALERAEASQMPASAIEALRLNLQVVEAGHPVRAAER